MKSLLYILKFYQNIQLKIKQQMKICMRCNGTGWINHSEEAKELINNANIDKKWKELLLLSTKNMKERCECTKYYDYNIDDVNKMIDKVSRIIENTPNEFLIDDLPLLEQIKFNDNHKLLWIFGDVGSGKTTLLYNIIGNYKLKQKLVKIFQENFLYKAYLPDFQMFEYYNVICIDDLGVDMRNPEKIYFLMDYIYKSPSWQKYVITSNYSIKQFAKKIYEKQQDEIATKRILSRLSSIAFEIYTGDKDYRIKVV